MFNSCLYEYYIFKTTKMDKYCIYFVRNFLTNLNFYPLNIFSHGLGAIGGSIADYISKDKALITNFRLQIPVL